MSKMPMQEISKNVLLEKYARNGETSIEEIQQRVAAALAAVEPTDQARHEKDFLQCMRAGFIPGGRIMASAGIDTKTTLINCFVQPIHDSMSSDATGFPGITDALQEAAETLRRGGGVGYDFSRLRPSGALVRGTKSHSSGPVSYMRVFNELCQTVESAGGRRGAQMAILRCDHPDILEFIKCKDEPGQMTAFNISVAATDNFVLAAQQGKEWRLLHSAEPSEKQKAQGARLHKDGLWCYRTISARDLWDTITRSTYDHAEPGVFFIDKANIDNNLGWYEHLESTNPCGEQPLPAYGCCDLGSINLTRLIRDPFTPKATFDAHSLEKIVPVAVRMLDNVLDATAWPLAQQQEESQATRRIGLGILGLGDALLMLGLPYDHKEGRAQAATIMRHIRDLAYSTSIGLAKEKGAFPRYDGMYLDSPFIERLPEAIQTRIHHYGIRNSHLLSIAPTGTISLAFADNASSGVEPPFSWAYVRKKIMEDGGRQQFSVEDFAHREVNRMYGDKAREITDDWKTALEISPRDHILMMAALQPYVDSAISKTVNVPEDAAFNDFQSLYYFAWEQGLKGLTTYRPNEVTGAVLSITPDKEPIPDKTGEDLIPKKPEHNQRIRLETVPKPALASLRWQRRPMLSEGNRSWTYMVPHPHGKFAVFIGEIETGPDKIPTPFEVWVNGEKPPRALGALAKNLSMDMRSEDGIWLQRKLQALMEVAGDDAFDMTLPPKETVIRAPSMVSGFARIIYHHCNSRGVFDDGPSQHHPMLSALISPAAISTGPDGTIGWTVDFENPNTGDDIILGLKELALPNGAHQPYQLWVSGSYPHTLEGLCRSLSLDMQIVDPAWIGAKLRQICDFHEPLGDFMAREPGSNRQRTYPSTVAYMARLLIHRYQMLGILDEDGTPVEAMGAMQVVEDPRSTASVRSVGASEVLPGRRCSECGSYTVIQRDGCKFCASCGHIGDCG